MTSLRAVTLTVSNTPTSATYLARSYPDDDRDNNGRIELYEVPVYKIFIDGTDGSGTAVRKEWRGLRFMPYFNDPKKSDPHYRTKGWVVAGLHSLSKRRVPQYKPDYGVQNRPSPYDGAIVMRNAFYIHAGPERLSDSGWGSAGCVEVIGNFDTFKNDIKNLSGSSRVDSRTALLELVRSGKLYVQVDYAKPPAVKFVKEV